MTQKQQITKAEETWGIRGKLIVDDGLMSELDASMLSPNYTIFQGIEPPEWQTNLPTEQDWGLRIRLILIKGKNTEEYNIPSSAGL